MNSLKSAPTLQDINILKNCNVHKLINNREGKISLDIKGRRSGYRLIIQPIDDLGKPLIDHGENLTLFYSSIKVTRIEEVSNHYE